MAQSGARLLAALALLQSRPSWTGAELAARLGVTGRTLRRDIGRLRELGYPVLAERGPAGGYRLGADGRLPPSPLGDDEALATAIALRTVVCGDVTGLAETASSALTKLAQGSPDRLRLRMSAVSNVALALPRSQATADPGTFSALASACHRSHRLRFGYVDHHGRESSRHVEPFRLVHSGRHWYLVGHDLHRAAWRVFRVDRIDRVLDTGSCFTLDEPPDAVGLLAEAITAGPYAHRAKIQLHTSADRAREDFPPTVGIVAAIDAETCELTVGADSVDAIVSHLGLVEYDFTVISPPQLQARVAAMAERFHRAAQRQQRA